MTIAVSSLIVCILGPQPVTLTHARLRVMAVKRVFLRVTALKSLTACCASTAYTIGASLPLARYMWASPGASRSELAVVCIGRSRGDLGRVRRILRASSDRQACWALERP